MKQKGVIHLVLPLLLIIIFIAGLFIMAALGVIKNPFKSLQLPSLSGKKEPTVSLQTSFKNPFDKGAQYVNPFSAYKNPFDSI